ncbi:protein kinase [Streptosporangium sp. NPDC000396]|uniref:serine/threonine-protein kinase n=1 Tax=Streptosporangium sp. NPDC000396 TaxID=3366185 RepID=UPI00368D16F9
MVPGYREVRELGVGGSGRVVLATYASTGAYVAIKYLNAALKDDPWFLARFREEARVMVELRDPNVVQFYEYYEDVLAAAIVMELVDGVALRKVLTDHGTTSPEAALTVLKGSLTGLASAHSAGIVHRDYKPENVLVQADGTSKLTDFGIATRAGEPDTPAGTPPYMAPEQWGGHPATPASDVYAATCVFFECLTGRRPYRADRHAALMHQHQAAPVPLDAVPSSVRGLVARGMAKNPADRPPTAQAFVTELEAAALSAYGPEWERRGRRHLAELATLLALAFPLARPASKASTSVARSVIGRAGKSAGKSAGRIRRPRIGPRVLAGVAVITVAGTVGLITANRASDRLSAGTIFTPAPGSPSAEDTPTASAGKRGSSPSEPITVPQSSRSAAPSKPSPRPSSGANAGRTAPPSATAGPSRPAPTPARTPSRAPTPSVPGTPPPPGHVVSGLTIGGIDANGTTIGVRASTAANVLLTVVLAEGEDRDRLTEAPARRFTLAGAGTYSQAVPHAFTAPACEQTLYRRVTVFTSPQAEGGARTRTAEVKGDPCPAPSVENVDITSFDGTTVRFRVRTGSTSAVTVKLGFVQKVTGGEGGSTSSARTLELSGQTDYTREVTGDFAALPECGRDVRRLVTVTTVPESGTRSREARIDLPPCEPDPKPDPSRSEPSTDGEQGSEPPVDIEQGPDKPGHDGIL